MHISQSSCWRKHLYFPLVRVLWVISWWVNVVPGHQGPSNLIKFYFLSVNAKLIRPAAISCFIYCDMKLLSIVILIWLSVRKQIDTFPKKKCRNPSWNLQPRNCFVLLWRILISRSGKYIGGKRGADDGEERTAGNWVGMEGALDTLWFQVLTLMIRESDLEPCLCTAQKLSVCVCVRTIS